MATSCSRSRNCGHTFVAPFGHRDRATAIVGSVVKLAHAVGLTVVAEGVEEPEQIALLNEMRCDFAQGFHFARPLDAEDAGRYLAGTGAALPRQRTDGQTAAPPITAANFVS